jgi:hypothetical protein
LGIVKQATQIDGKRKEVNNNNSKIISATTITTNSSTLDAFMA